MSNEISQSQEAIQRVVFKIFERWGEREDRLSLLISLIDNPTLSPKEERQLVQILVSIKNNSEDFDIKLKNVTDFFDEYANQKKEMLTYLSNGNKIHASKIKETLIEGFNPTKNEIQSLYEDGLLSAIVQVKKEFNELIGLKELKSAEDLLDSYKTLLPDYEFLKNNIANFSANHERSEKFLTLLDKNLFNEIVDLCDTPLEYYPAEQEFCDAICTKVIALIDDKSLDQAEIITNTILIKLLPFPKELHAFLQERVKTVKNEMRSEIQRLVDSKEFIEAASYLASFELSESQSARLSNLILQSSHAEEAKQQARQMAEEAKQQARQKAEAAKQKIFQHINQHTFLDIYPLIKKTQFSDEDSREIDEALITALKNKLEVSNIDTDQALALICDEQFQLISARAGSGKTTTLINKVKLLVSLNKINLSEYLFLVFNRKVRTEIAEELSETFSIDIDEVKSSNVHTFNSFARRVSANSLAGYDLVVDQAKNNLYRQAFLKALKTSTFNSKYKKYIFSIVSPSKNDLDAFDRSNFESDQEYFEARSSARLLTLNNIHVKSIGEKLIGDFFFEHGLVYTYEPTLITSNKIYRPDFYINNLATNQNKKIYIELWGIYKDRSLDSGSSPIKDLHKYMLEREMKLEYWSKESNGHLMELFMDDVHGNNINIKTNFIAFKENFYKILTHKLEKIIKTKLKRLSEEEVMQKVSKLFESKILSSLESYISNVRNNQIQPNDLNLKINKYDESLTDRAKAFLDLGFEFRKFIHEEKKHLKVHEFVDAIDKAGIQIELDSNIELIKEKKYLFVDEFQDTNFGFLKLIQSIIKAKPEINVICVGDDWQSINSFQGARPSIFHSLDKHLPGLERNHILTNYRSGSAIVNYGNQLMSGLGSPSKSFFSSGLAIYLDITSVKYDGDFNIYIDSEKNKYDDGFKLQRYHSLLFTLIKFEIHKCIDNNSSNSIYDIPKDAELLILSRKKNINMESVQSNLIPIVISSLAKYFVSIGYKEDNQEIEIRLNQLVSYSTVHAIKGGQADVVILIEANANTMPLQHPDRELSAIFCDDPGKADAEADAEERRLYYVAVTRAKESLYVVTTKSEASPFMSNKPFAQLEKFSVDDAAI
ncbi:UvrD-helicase domain-containing protein [Gammaproteobacteria bacterium]|nr:UvrD-helicase domain-containing protein [Gammaproteobacteria bacterium]